MLRYGGYIYVASTVPAISGAWLNNQSMQIKSIQYSERLLNMHQNKHKVRDMDGKIRMLDAAQIS